MFIDTRLTIINPYFGIIKYLDTNIFEKFNRPLYTTDFIYRIIKENKDIDYNDKLDKKLVKKIGCDLINTILTYLNRDINTDHIINKNGLFLFMNENLQNTINKKPLNESELIFYNELINKYRNEFYRICNIKNHFIQLYIDANNYKPVHLSSKCKEREYCTSKCDLKEFIYLLKDIKNTFDFITSIKTSYKELLTKFNINIDINGNCNIEIIFILIKVCDLFDKYISILLYSIQLIKTKPYIIRYSDDFLINITDNCFFKYTEDKSIYINPVNTILDIYLKKYNNILKANYIKFTITEKRKNIYFTDI